MELLGSLNRRFLLNAVVVWRLALKLAYDGKDFFGFQRQPDVRTVEGEILRALKAIGAIDSAKTSRFRGASRTDTGVSALGNVVALDTEFSKDQILRALNAVSEGVYFYGIAEVPSDFSPRRARQRWYRYFLQDLDLDLEKVTKCAEEFEGKHDFKHFSREGSGGTVRSIDDIKVFRVGDLVVIDFLAREYLWNMVRRMVAALSEVGKGRIEVESVRDSLLGKEACFGLAPAEFLVLMDVMYDFDFEYGCPSTLKRKLRLGSDLTMIKLAFYGDLTDRCRKQV